MDQAKEPSSTEDRITKALRAVVSVAIFAVLLMPMVVWNAVPYPYVLPKAWWVQLVVGLGLPAYVLLVRRSRVYGPTWTPLYTALVVQVGVLVACTAFAADPLRALWGSAERMDGLYTFLHFFAWTTMAAANLRTWPEVRRFLQTAVVLFTLCNLWGYMGGKVTGTGRSEGLLGNAGFFGEFQVTVLFLLAMLALRVRALGWRLFYAGSAVLAVLCLLASGTRGAMLGLLAGASVAALVLLFQTQHRRVTWAAVIGGAALLSAYGAVAVFGLGRQTAFFHRLYFGHPSIGRLLVLAGTPPGGGSLAGSTDIRFMFWREAWNAFKARPLLGWGVDNFNVAMGPHFDPKLLAFGFGWADHAHNILFDVLTMTGVVGLLAWIGVWGSAFVMLVQARRAKKLDGDMFALLMGFPVGILVSKAILFDHLAAFMTSAMFFAMVLVFHRGVPETEGRLASPGVVSDKRRTRRNPRGPQQRSTAVPNVALAPLSPAVALGAYAVTLSLLAFTTVLPARTAVHLGQALNAVARQHSRTASDAMREVFEGSPLFRYDAVLGLAATLPDHHLETLARSKSGREALELVRTHGNKTVRQHVRDGRFWGEFGKFLTFYGGAVSEAKILQEAREVLSHALEIAPARADFRMNLAWTYAFEKDWTSVEKELALVASIDRDVGYLAFVAGVTWLEMGKEKEALPYFLSAMDASIPPIPRTPREAAIYAKLRQDPVR